MLSDIHSGLLAVTDQYLRITGICPATFGEEVANDAEMIARLRAGMKPQDSTANDILDRIIEHVSTLLLANVFGYDPPICDQPLHPWPSSKRQLEGCFA